MNVTLSSATLITSESIPLEQGSKSSQQLQNEYTISKNDKTRSGCVKKRIHFLLIRFTRINTVLMCVSIKYFREIRVIRA